MLETYSIEELRPLVGHEVVDVNGTSVGYVDLIFVDTDSARAEWLGVWNGVWETRPRVLVPLRGAELVEDEIRVPYTSDVIEDAPTYEDEDDRGLFTDDEDSIGIGPDKERLAYEHYGVGALTTAATPDAARFRALRTPERAPGARPL
jgi:sporulation protein YlmC with PRC-barrel domain